VDLLAQADWLGPMVGGHLALRATFVRWTGWTLTVAVPKWQHGTGIIWQTLCYVMWTSYVTWHLPNSYWRQKCQEINQRKVRGSTTTRWVANFTLAARLSQTRWATAVGLE